MMYDLAIIGGGPAGVAAGVYASRKRLTTAFLTDSFGGQSSVSEQIENWIGTPKISGADLAKNLEAHLRSYAGDVVDIHTNVKVKIVEKAPAGFALRSEDGRAFEASAVLVATGSHRRKLTVPGADRYENKGITYCASCDGPLFSDQEVVVIGGGNAAFETAAQLSAYCKKVTMLQRSPEFRADEVTRERVFAMKNVVGIAGTEILEVKGSKFVESIVYKETASGKTVDLPTSGIFVEIGLIPTTYFVQHLVALDPYNHIKVDPRTQATSVPGIWAAGDCTDGLYHQNNIAAGDAVKALEDIYLALKAR